MSSTRHEPPLSFQLNTSSLHAHRGVQSRRGRTRREHDTAGSNATRAHRLQGGRTAPRDCPPRHDEAEVARGQAGQPFGARRPVPRAPSADVLASIRNGEYLFKRHEPSYEVELDLFRTRSKAPLEPDAATLPGCRLGKPSFVVHVPCVDAAAELDDVGLILGNHRLQR